MKRTYTFLILILLFGAGRVASQVFLPDAEVMAQGGSLVAVSEGFPALLGNPAGFRLGDGEWTLGRVGVHMALDPVAVLRDGGDALIDQAREKGFSTGLSLGFGFVGRGLGLGLLAGSDATFSSNQGLVEGSVDNAVTLVGGYSYPLEIGGVELALGGAVRPIMRFHTPVSSEDSMDFVEALVKTDGLAGSLRGSETYYGVAVAFDLGLLVSAGPTRFGFSARDVGGTRFFYSKSDWNTLLDSILSLRGLPEGDLTDEVLEVPMVLSAGAGLFPFEGFSAHAEIRDLGLLFSGDLPFLEALHLGVVSSAGARLEFRGGFSAGRPTVGAGLALGGFRLDLAYVGRSWVSADNEQEVPIVALGAGFTRKPRSRELR